MSEENVEELGIETRVQALLAEADVVFGKVHARMRTDLRFVGASDQWDETDIRLRGENRARQQFPVLDKYVERLVGNYNANPYSIQVEALDASSADMADSLQGLVNAIESKSETRYAYRQSLRNAASTGYGWLSVTTDYGDDETSSKFVEVKIETIEDPCSVVIDPASRFVDGRDASWACVREWVGKKTAKEIFGAEAVKDPDGSAWPEGDRSDRSLVEVLTFYELVRGDKDAKDDADKTDHVVKYRLVGGRLHGKGKRIPLNRIPVVPVYGLPVIEDGRVNYVSVVHRAIDAQKNINFAVSTGAERLALSPTAKIAVSEEAVAGKEEDYADANRSNKTLLTYKAYDDAGRKLDAPAKIDPAVNGADIAQYYNLYTLAVTETVGIPLDGIGGSTTKQLTAEETLTKARAAETVLSTIYENLAASVRAVGRLAIELVASQYVGMRSYITQDSVTGERKKVENVDFDKIRVDLESLDIRVEAGPLLSTQRKENVKCFLQLFSIAPDIYKPLLFAKIMDNMDGVDAQTQSAVRQIAFKGLDQIKLDADKLARLTQENQNLKNQLAQTQLALVGARARSQDAAVRSQAGVLAAKINADMQLKKEAMQQGGETEREQQRLSVERQKDIERSYNDMVRNSLERDRIIQSAVSALNGVVDREAKEDLPDIMREAAPPPQGGI